jgi:hypothetical protein
MVVEKASLKLWKGCRLKLKSENAQILKLKSANLIRAHSWQYGLH